MIELVVERIFFHATGYPTESPIGLKGLSITRDLLGEQNMLKGHLPIVIYITQYTDIRRQSLFI